MKHEIRQPKDINSILLLCITLLSLLIMVACSGGGQPASAIDKKIETAVLAEDWAKVAMLLDTVSIASPSTIHRLLKAHACLALNRHNQSLALFLSSQIGDSAKSADGLKEWQIWAQQFERRNPRKAVARYFAGDAAARLGQWDEALKAFNEGIRLASKHPMILNARGVVFAQRKDWNSAITDLQNAAASALLFADAHASLGMMWIQKQDGAPGALKAFDKALDCSPNFAAASYGRACLRALLGRWEQSDSDVVAITQLGDTVGWLLTACLDRAFDSLTGSAQITLDSTSENPSTRIDRYIDGFKTGNLGLFGANVKNGLKLARSADPATRMKFTEALRQTAIQNPKLAPYIAKYVNEVKNSALYRAKTYEGRTTLRTTDLNLKGMGLVGKVLVAGKGGFEGTIIQKYRPFASEYRGLASLAGKIETRLPKTYAQGFKTGTDEATWDRGGWSFTPIFGLAYDVSSQPHPVRETGE